MPAFKEFASDTARPLPVVLLADVSGSMIVEGKIGVLNQAVAQMVRSFAAEEDFRAEICVAVITFGEDARLHIPLTPARKVAWQDIQAKGKTPLGGALKLARQLLEDQSAVPHRAYRPVLVLVSDGKPTDDWKESLEELLKSPRGLKADRWSLAVGADADEDVLRAFLGDPQKPLLRARDAPRISSFFNFVTVSVQSRLRSVTPNDQPMIDPEEFKDLY